MSALGSKLNDYWYVNLCFRFRCYIIGSRQLRSLVKIVHNAGL